MGNVWRNACKNSPINTAKPLLHQRKRRPLTLRSEPGEIKLVFDYGQNRVTGQWGSPVRQAWGLALHQKITPVLAEKLTVKATGSMCFSNRSLRP